MKCVPMIFNREMVCALLEGRKTVTRRPLKIKPEWHFEKIGKITSSHPKKGSWGAFVRKGAGTDFPETDLIKAPCWIGDLIWVRETFCMGRIFDHDSGHPASDYLYVEQCKDDKNYPIYKQQCLSDGVELEEVRWTPSIHMPRRASRLTLKVTDVRIERVKEITDDQAEKEGMMTTEASQKKAIECGLSWFERPAVQFKNLWQRIYEDWESNPYVWVIEFEVVNQNIDKYLNGVNKCQ